jgi:protein-disulfide isomerase
LITKEHNLSSPKPSKSEQREAARAKARELREQNAKKEKRNKLLLQISVVVVALGIVGGVGAVIAIENANRVAAPVVSDTPENLTELGGIKIGVGLQAFTAANTPTADAAEDVPEIIIYQDYQCPICQAFDVPNSSQIRSWVDTGAATVEFRPLSFLDRASLNEYSSRAANAAFCVANFEPDSYFDFNEIAMTNQPSEGGEGPSDDEIFSWAEEAGAGTDEVKGCIQNKSFEDYLFQQTQTVLSAPHGGVSVTGTPTILVNGVQYSWATGEELTSAERFAQFVQSATAQ